MSDIPHFLQCIEGLGQLIDFQFTCYNELHSTGELVTDIKMVNHIYQYLWSYKEMLVKLQLGKAQVTQQ